MRGQICFTSSEKVTVRKSFSRAQEFTSRYFDLGLKDWQQFPYDVRTLAELENHEVQDGVFAHLCKYPYKGVESRESHPHFFRICLQDHRILNALARSDSFIKFFPLMLYIATHEIVHILRFHRGECDFNTEPESRQCEEERVNCVTRDILKTVRDPGLDLVMDCFGRGYRLKGIN